LQRLYRARAIKVTKSLDSGLRVACDRQDLNEILANLLDNAFKHAGSRVEVAAGIAKSGGNVVILIDDGPGLSAEAREIVFNVGERWDCRKAAYLGHKNLGC
jgi:signal transduction histidine kinase